jgi:hypothetical protein
VYLYTLSVNQIRQEIWEIWEEIWDMVTGKYCTYLTYTFQYFLNFCWQVELLGSCNSAVKGLTFSLKEKACVRNYASAWASHGVTDKVVGFL